MPDELLAVGSVVRLEGAAALVMVMGFEPQVGEVQADYLGVPWPVGLVSEDAALTFDRDAVAEVVHRGYWDQEGDAALAAVRRYRDAAADVKRQLDEFLASLTTERIVELRTEYVFDALDEEPEPDFPDEELAWEDVLSDEVLQAVQAFTGEAD